MADLPVGRLPIGIREERIHRLLNPIMGKFVINTYIISEALDLLVHQLVRLVKWENKPSL